MSQGRHGRRTSAGHLVGLLDATDLRGIFREEAVGQMGAEQAPRERLGPIKCNRCGGDAEVVDLRSIDDQATGSPKYYFIQLTILCERCGTWFLLERSEEVA